MKVNFYNNNDTELIYCTQLPNRHIQYLYSSSHFKVLHQNVRGLTKKTEELLISLSNLEPQVLCLAQHHLKSEEIININLSQYTLGAHYCRRTFKQGGVSIFILKGILFYTVDLNIFNKDKDFEICTLKIPLSATCLLLLCVYRSPSGDFSYFVEQLESVLNKLYKISNNIILCGDFNVNFFSLPQEYLLLSCFLFLLVWLALSNFPEELFRIHTLLLIIFFLI